MGCSWVELGLSWVVVKLSWGLVELGFSWDGVEFSWGWVELGFSWVEVELRSNLGIYRVRVLIMEFLWCLMLDIYDFSLMFDARCLFSINSEKFFMIILNNLSIFYIKNLSKWKENNLILFNHMEWTCTVGGMSTVKLYKRKEGQRKN